MGLKSIYGIIFENQERQLDKTISERWSTPKFEKDKVRLVIFNDNERDRQILFDSKAIKRIDESQVESKICSHRAKMAARFRKVPEVEKSSEVDAASKCKFQFQKPGSDVQMMEEMMFGCVGMAYKGTSLKVHFLKSPPQMMLTKVFIPENPKRESMGSELDSDSCSSQSHSDHSGPKQISQQNNKNNSNIAQSVPVDVPSPRETRASFELIDEDSGLASLTSSGSFHTPLPSPGSNASSFNSLHRRWMRVQSTSLEGCLRKRNSQDNLLAQDTQSAPTRSRKRKIALGILFDLSENDDEYNRLFQNFFFSHITLFEGHLEKLKVGVERAYYMRRKFVYLVMEALDAFRNDVMDLYVTPRLSEPVWLNMMAYSNYRYVLCEKFMKEFMLLVKNYDNKNTNFFVSTLVTAVLTHHLAWVPTVMPAGGSPSRTYLDKHSAKWLDTFSKVHPYNPLWAQLGDLYGAIGFPLKLARTVVVGQKADLVKKILYILSYFIRCSDVQETPEWGSLQNCLNELHFDSPVEGERMETTPIREDSTDSSFCFLGREDIVSVCSAGKSSDKDLKTTETDSKDAGLDSTNARREFKNLTNKQKQKEAIQFQDIVLNGIENDNKEKKDSDKERLDPDEGYASIQHDNDDSLTLKPCKMSVSKIHETVPVENVQYVSKSVTNNVEDSVLPVKPSALSPKSPSKLSQRLAEEENAKQNNNTNCEKKATVSDIRTQFIKEGSNSMFNEYFDNEEIEIKTIDEVDSSQRVMSNSSVTLTGSRTNLESSVHSGDMSSSFSSQSELTSIHDSRLGSFGQGIRPRISSMSRQLSTDKSARPTTLAPGRCRSVTPTELRRRHLSSNSSLDFDFLDPLIHCKEIEMPNFSENVKGSSITVFDRNFGRSLLAGYSNHYLSDFVLHGTSDNKFHDKLVNDLQMHIQHSVLDEPIGEAVCVIADTDKWTVNVASSRLIDKHPTSTQQVVASQLVLNLTESVLQLWKLKMSPEFCLMHLEDRLQEIYFKSKMLAEYLKDVKKYNIKDLTQLLGFDTSDVPLLVAIAGTHSPHLSLGLI